MRYILVVQTEEDDRYEVLEAHNMNVPVAVVVDGHRFMGELIDYRTKEDS